MQNLEKGVSDIIVVEPGSLTSGTGLQVVKIVSNFISFIWTRKAKEPDEFELVVESTADNIMTFTEDRLIILNDFQEMVVQVTGGDPVICKHTDRVGIVESIDCKTANDPEYASTMTIKGRSLEALFERRIVWEADQLWYYDGTDKTTKYSDMIYAIYDFLSQDLIAPTISEERYSQYAPDPITAKRKKVKPDASKYQNRAIWNIIMGDYGSIEDQSNPYLEDAINAEEHISNFFVEDTINVAEYDGTDLLTVLKNVCDNYSISMRTYLLVDVPGWVFDKDNYDSAIPEILGLGKLNPMYDKIRGASKLGYLDTTQLDKISVIVLELRAPTNNSFIGNNSGDYVIFSQNVDNLKDVQFTKAYSQIKNIARVKGEDKGKKTQNETQMNALEEPIGWKRRELFVDASDITQEKNGRKYLDDVYLPALREAGKNALTEHSRNRNYVFDGTTIMGLESNVYEYGKDYEIGDFVQLYDEIFDESVKVQITEVIESLDSSSGYKMSASFDQVVMDFKIDDPLRYYYYTIDDENKIITITGIKLEQLMADGVGDLGIIQFTANVYSEIRKKKIKKEVNDKVVKEYYINNPDETESMKLNMKYGTSGASTNTDVAKTMVDTFGITPKYQDYSIKLNLVYSI